MKPNSKVDEMNMMMIFGGNEKGISSTEQRVKLFGRSKYYCKDFVNEIQACIKYLLFHNSYR